MVVEVQKCFGQKGDGNPRAPTRGANGGGGPMAAPARVAKRKARKIVSESDDDDDDIGYGSKGDLGWSKSVCRIRRLKHRVHSLPTSYSVL